MLAGAVWGLVPGFLKAVCNVNEVIACIMMNYIGMYGVNFLIQLTVFDSLKNQSLPVAENANAPKLGMDLIFRSHGLQRQRGHLHCRPRGRRYLLPH